MPQTQAPTKPYDAELATDDLVLRSLVGSKGYLKIPKAFQRKYMKGITGKTLPTPEAYIRTRDGHVQIIYQWSKEELNHD